MEAGFGGRVRHVSAKIRKEERKRVIFPRAFSVTLLKRLKLVLEMSQEVEEVEEEAHRKCCASFCVSCFDSQLKQALWGSY